MTEGEDKKKVTAVLIGIDDSEHCLHAFEYYTEHIHKPDSEVILFHVSDQVRVPVYAYPYMPEGMVHTTDDVQSQVKTLRRKNKELEEKYNEKCKALQIKHRFVLVSEDFYGPGHAIIESAKKHQANLIVVGSRGLGALKRTILGSVSTYVVHHGHIPALVCPPK